MAAKGHDAYLANNRGTDYSRKHVFLDPVVHEKHFWDFSWEDMALDVTANVGTVVEHSAQEAILMVAYSQGAKQLMKALEEHGAKMSLVAVAALFAPCVQDSDLEAFVSQADAEEVI